MSNDAGGFPMAGPPPPGYPPAGYPPPGYPRLSAARLPGLSAARRRLPAARLSHRRAIRHRGDTARHRVTAPQVAIRRPAIPRRDIHRPDIRPRIAPVRPPVAPALKPGVIPLRPLSLSDIFNGAVAYIRANPKATLGLTTVVVVAAQILALILSVGPLAVSGELHAVAERRGGVDGCAARFVGIQPCRRRATWLSSILLSGMLTVVVGRAVFGASITIGEAWQRLRPRLWALIGFTVLEVIGAAVLVTVVVAHHRGVAVAPTVWRPRSSGCRSCSALIAA